MSRRTLAVALLALALHLGPARAGDPYLDYAVDVNGVLYQVDLERLTTRSLGRIQVGDETPTLCDLVATPDGYLFGVSGTSVYRINIEKPEQSLKVGDHGLDDPYAVGLGPNGRVFATTRDGRTFVIDPTTARSTEVGALGSSFAASGDLALVGETLYGSVKDAASREHLVVIDPATGRARAVGAFVDAATGAALPNVFGLVFRNGALFGFLASGPIVRVDPKTARCTVVARTGIRWWGATEYFRL